MRRDIAKFYKVCSDCQKSKISRRKHIASAQFAAPYGRFQHVHMDIVGPLPVSYGYKYCFTMIDRFSRWAEAVPLKDIEALTVCRAFVNQWISRNGAPGTLTTDQGSQFESKTSTALLPLTRCHRIRTTPYHPAANRMIECWYRLLKGSGLTLWKPFRLRLSLCTAPDYVSRRNSCSQTILPQIFLFL